MSLVIAAALVTLAALGFAGAGIALAVARTREIIEVAPAIMLFALAASCAFVVTGVSGICAFGGAVSWFSYVVSAHRMRVFWVEQPDAFQRPATERKHIA